MNAARLTSPLRQPRTYIRAAFSILIATLTLWLCAALLPGLTILSWRDALGTAIAIAITNAIIWPLLIRFALPITVLTLGLAGLLLNGVLVWAVLSTTDGLHVDSLGTSLLVAPICYIEKMPDVEFTKDDAVREWVFRTPELKALIGGSL